MQIIVLGMHRSGTSLTTRLINMMGAYVGPEGKSLGFNHENPKGFWERKDTLEQNIALLQLRQADWANPANWQPPAELPQPLRRAMKSLILGMDAHRPWVMKDPRQCLTLPCWKPLLEIPVCVIVYRDPLEIARSLELRNGMALARGLALWECYAVHLLNATAGMECVFASHHDFLRDPVKATAKLHAALTVQGVQGLRLPSAREITAFIDPALYRSKPQAMQPLSPHQQELAEMLRGQRRVESKLTISPESEALLREPFAVQHL